MASTKHPPGNDDTQDGMARIVRRHAHDVRNHLNILELESVMLGELMSDPAAIATIRRIRTQLVQLDNTVKALLFKFTEPRLAVVTAGDLLQLWKNQVTPLLSPEQSMEWPATSETSQLSVDVNAVAFVLRELTVAAWKRAPGFPLKAALHANADTVVVELREPAHDVPMNGDLMDDVTKLIQANGGGFDRAQIPGTGEWLTTLTFTSDRP